MLTVCIYYYPFSYAFSRVYVVPVPISQAAIVLDGITARGVLTPVLPEIYLPGLERLAAEGLAFEENEL